MYHVQQSADPGSCLVLHLTFVEGWPKNPAKNWRLREAGLLPVDPEPFGAKYLAFTPPQLTGPVPPEREPSLGPRKQTNNGDMPDKTPDGKGWPVATAVKGSPRLAAHLDLTDRNIAALRNAMAMAKARHPPARQPAHPTAPRPSFSATSSIFAFARLTKLSAV